MTARAGQAVLFGGFVATVIAANWAIHRYGIVSIGFGLHAPAGVFFAGLALGLRDALQERGGVRLVAAAIGVGAAVSYWVGDAAEVPGGRVSIAVASGVAFAVSEVADLAVYTPLRERSWPGAVVVSNVVGAVIDSLVFLPLAFGSRDGWTDLVVGKLYLVPAGLLLVSLARRRLR